MATDTKTGQCKVRISTRYCKGCGLCVSVCKFGQIKPGGPINELGYQTVVFEDSGQCTLCQNCVVVCPDAAVEIVDED